MATLRSARHTFVDKFIHSNVPYHLSLHNYERSGSVLFFLNVNPK